MDIDYKKIGKRIADRRRTLGLKQSEVEERAEIGYKYLSNIERGISIPSTEVIIRIAKTLDTTPDEFLVGSYKDENADIQSISAVLKTFDDSKLTTAKRFVMWLKDYD